MKIVIVLLTIFFTQAVFAAGGHTQSDGMGGYYTD